MNNERYYLITGAAGFLGSNICAQLLAAGTIAAVDKGRVGECYILANEPVTLKQMCDMINAECDSKKIKLYLPLNLAGKIAQGLEKQAEKTGKKPIMTTFSVYNLARNNVFDYSKACNELGYTTRSYRETIRDMVQWMKEEGLVAGDPQPVVMTRRELVDSGIVPDVMHAMEHDIDPASAFEVAKDAYKAIEEGVVGAYKAVEKGAVDAYRKVEETMVDKLFRKDGETVEQAKTRLRK